MTVDFGPITAEVARYTTIKDSVKALLAAQAQAKADAVAAAIADTTAKDGATAADVAVATQAALDDVKSQFAANNDDLAAAVVANTV